MLLNVEFSHCKREDNTNTFFTLKWFMLAHTRTIQVKGKIGQLFYFSWSALHLLHPTKSSTESSGLFELFKSVAQIQNF